MELLWSEIGTKLGDLLEMGRSGVIASLIATSQRLQTHERKVYNLIFEFLLFINMYLNVDVNILFSFHFSNDEFMIFDSVVRLFFVLYVQLMNLQDALCLEYYLLTDISLAKIKPNGIFLEE